MSPGKTASQAGHSYLGTFEIARQSHPESCSEYHKDFPSSPGTKICLEGTLDQILEAYDKAKSAGLPAYLVVDSGCPNFFDGKPTVTALGIGPAKKSSVKQITNKFKLHK